MVTTVVHLALLFCSWVVVGCCEAAATLSDFPLLWDIGGAGVSDLNVPELVKATPRVQLDKIRECPHP
jgi:hypothetical protein